MHPNPRPLRALSGHSKPRPAHISCASRRRRAAAAPDQLRVCQQQHRLAQLGLRLVAHVGTVLGEAAARVQVVGHLGWAGMGLKGGSGKTAATSWWGTACLAV